MHNNQNNSHDIKKQINNKDSKPEACTGCVGKKTKHSQKVYTFKCYNVRLFIVKCLTIHSSLLVQKQQLSLGNIYSSSFASVSHISLIVNLFKIILISFKL